MKLTRWINHTLCLVSFSPLLVTSISTSRSTSTEILSTYEVPTFTLSGLSSSENDDRLKDVLSQTGLLAIRIPTNTNVASSSKDPLQSLCPYSQSIQEERIAGADQIVLQDGITTRSTIATACHGTHSPLELPREDIVKAFESGHNSHTSRENAHEVVDKLEASRDLVSLAVTEGFLPALDRLLVSETRTSLLSKRDGVQYKSVQEILEDAVHLEHFHVYDKQESLADNHKHKHKHNIQQDSTLDWHTDAGLFLAFLPATSCDDTQSDLEQDDSFRVLVPSTSTSTSTTAQYNEQIARFPSPNSNEIIVSIMLGTGAQHWLHLNQHDDVDHSNGLQLKATRHAVKMRPGKKRVWYGKMYLVSSQAIIHTTPQNQSLTLSDMRNSIPIHSFNRRFGNKHKHNSHDPISIGCGTASTSLPTLVPSYPTNSNSNSSRRRLQHGVEPSACTNSIHGTDFYCWMQCLSSPNDDISPLNHSEDGESLYCANLAVLAESKDLNKAIAACTDEVGVVGGVMDDGCENIWHPTIDGAFTHVTDGISVASQEVDQNDLLLTNDLYDEKYCYGATAMYMHGFEWESTTCIVYLFQSWVITSRGAFIGACLGTILFGIFVEAVVKQRRLMVERFTKPVSKLMVSTMFYGIQLTNGYLIMLVVMTYSGPLVICVVLGLMCGHVICNWNAIFGKGQTEEKKKNATIDLVSGTTPCCVSEKDLDNKKAATNSNTSDSNGDTSVKDDDSDIEGYNCCCDDTDNI